MTLCLIALGGNMGNRLGNLRRAAGELAFVARIILRSGVYETPPWGVGSQPRFLNACLSIETDMKPRELLAAVKGVELAMGRVSREHWGPREIDIDILTHGDISLNEEDLVIPHPLMYERSFVLVPLADIAPDWKHPVTGESLSGLLQKTGRDGIVKIALL